METDISFPLINYSVSEAVVAHGRSASQRDFGRNSVLRHSEATPNTSRTASLQQVSTSFTRCNKFQNSFVATSAKQVKPRTNNKYECKPFCDGVGKIRRAITVILLRIVTLTMLLGRNTQAEPALSRIMIKFFHQRVCTSIKFTILPAIRWLAGIVELLRLVGDSFQRWAYH